MVGHSHCVGGPTQHRPRVFSTYQLAAWLAFLAIAVALVGQWPAARAAAPTSAHLSASRPSGQPVGTSIAWSAQATGFANPVYRFSVGTSQNPARVVQDFSPTPSFTWVPLHEGAYAVQVTVKDGFAATSVSSSTVTFTVKSLVTGPRAVVSPTANPLVALYSAPACSGGTLVVQYRTAAGRAAWESTARKPCHAGQSVNVLVAGMRASTRYVLRHVVSGGNPSATLPFTTGKPLTGLTITPFTVKLAMTGQADLPSAAIFHALNPSPSPAFANPVATDLAGHLVWYYDTLRSGLTEIWPVRIVAGGTVLLLGEDRYRTTGDDVLREIDLAGTTVRETNIDAVNVQLARRGAEPIYMFHHDALRLPNGDTAVLGATQSRYGGRNVMSDMVIVLDANFQVVWTWDYFDHFNPPAIYPPMAGPCNVTGKLCGLPDPKSVDWTHGNGIGWSPGDGNLILSFRSTSWVIKVAYQNGHGNGQVVWRLGKGGDFTVRSADAYPWFSQQHNATYVSNTTVVIFDDGNTRCQNGKVKGCESRGQVYRLDETHHVATLLVNANLGQFWQALGSAQGLPDGDSFYAGGFSPPSKEEEIRPNGTAEYELDAPVAEYRAYWTPDLSF